jgi:hypothetical protein
MSDDIDYRIFYDDETYLLDVGQRFRESGTLDPVDFYMMLAWKANRAKNYHRENLKRLSKSSFEYAVSQIAAELHGCSGLREKLEILRVAWEFALPTATAVLTLLYPDDFTVYDVLVCGELQWDYHPDRYFSAKLWSDYQVYKQAVIKAAPPGSSLRDKDRYLIGRAYRKAVETDCRG